MHDSTLMELARARHLNLLNDADRHRLALQARGEVRRAGRRRSFLDQVRRRRPEQRPAPAV